MVQACHVGRILVKYRFLIQVDSAAIEEANMEVTAVIVNTWNPRMQVLFSNSVANVNNTCNESRTMCMWAQFSMWVKREARNGKNFPVNYKMALQLRKFSTANNLH